MNLDIQGHRGCRGLYPENTIEAFEHAMSLEVNTLEFDVVISKDKKVIVSHEPFMNHEFCLKPDGSEIAKEDEQNYNLYELTYNEIKEYNTGKKFNPKYPDQIKINTFKPSLNDVVSRTESIDKSILYNIEIKRRPEWDNEFHPVYNEFADLVIAEITNLGIMDRTTVQCFDVETLQYINSQYPDVKLVYLIQNLNGPQENIETLGFDPHVYSPYFKLVTPELISYCHGKNIQVIPWTVNHEDNMNYMIDLGVDGIITDYPDRLIEIVSSK